MNSAIPIIIANNAAIAANNNALARALTDNPPLPLLTIIGIVVVSVLIVAISLWIGEKYRLL